MSGLYRESFEHDACGIGFITQVKGEANHQLVLDGITMLENMEHRGGTGIDVCSGDGAGMLTQIPDEFFKSQLDYLGLDLPEAGKYGVAMLFMPSDKHLKSKCRNDINVILEKNDFELIGYRKVPVDNSTLGDTPKSTEPAIEQLFVTHETFAENPKEFERRLYVLRKEITNTIHTSRNMTDEDFYIPSFSSKTIIYKGQLTTFQLKDYYKDITNPLFKSRIILIHSRFSTNTFPKWHLAQPFRFLAHNGEINTIQGNVNWMQSFQNHLESSYFSPQDISTLNPIVKHTNSDSCNLDNMLELLYQGGRSLQNSMMMLIPEAWQEDDIMDKQRKEFYQYHASLIEPWDGPASLCFTNGEIVGATLDRNGLRPSRFCFTKDGRIILSSEAGALPVEEENILRKGRLEPGRIFLIDLNKEEFIEDEEVKKKIVTEKPYGKWLENNEIEIDNLPERKLQYTIKEDQLFTKQKMFGYTEEDLHRNLVDTVTGGKEPIGSMGADTPLAVLSEKPQHLSNYFKQHFAQVSNPPIDPLRERVMMSTKTSIGRSFNILSSTPAHCKQITFENPVVTNEQLEKIRQIDHTNFRTRQLNAVYLADGKPGRLKEALEQLCKEADKALLDEGMNILLLSDREANELYAPIPSLLATGTIHHHLTRKKLRVRTGIAVEAGDVMESHHFATLIGYGANVVNPYMTFANIDEIVKESKGEIDTEKAYNHYIKSVNQGLLKIFSKMGISTLQSYHGAQIFEAVGIHPEVIEYSFTGTVSRIGGLMFDDISREILSKHSFAYNEHTNYLQAGGYFQWKKDGEEHLFSPEAIHLLQQCAWKNDYQQYKRFAEVIDNSSRVSLRSLLKFKMRVPVPIEEVEPVESILKRFSTGAMSFGSLSWEAHTSLAIAMNKIGGKSNSGEGGEDEKRYTPLENGDNMRSSIKQVASGRFGVTIEYLSEANELQIKVAQGAKPGEGGQLPGFKVDEWIGRVRNATPGVSLISPPPHHDIYSIEDLAQLIYDLKSANPSARINVKLVSKAGVGTIAAGVAKAKAEAIMISGYDGGTGASPISSIKHAGLPWELGLAEANQTLVMNGLRDRVVLQTDGQLRTARDIAIATLLGAEEWSISTAALVTQGCIMMRKCHTNTCPVGVATQNKTLRELFSGKPEYVVNYFTHIATELREIMAKLGFKTINEMVGKTDVLKESKKDAFWKLNNLDLTPILFKPENQYNVTNHAFICQAFDLEGSLNQRMVNDLLPKFSTGENISKKYKIINLDRAVGATLSYYQVKFQKENQKKPPFIALEFEGSAGQSFGSFTNENMRLVLTGESNDYLGKGLSGATLVVKKNRIATFKSRENSITGNVALYGATSGDVYINGRAGERFAVRNSGAHVIAEGIGAHGCEYMTGGRVIILGTIGRNFGAGMSGGIAYVLKNQENFEDMLNMEMIEYDTFRQEEIEFIKGKIQQHIEYTNSSFGKEILADWDTYVTKFVKIIPTEYKKILSQQTLEVQK
ncbi:glutamate synthase large subunit [Neptunitalea lumnitzerae]|uniref:Glutamate synthase n=1 Tax=Neptunitalea lumnitzerae TaxID=2965509 RepID=A0ABQ5ME38_9FLAO|nr:glutamate synthase large subunit [Neptunitalea sp. Y10]GLB47641.1 glutamate synthase [Neptunitalea sp. Y10]